MQSFGISKSIKLLTVIVIALSLALITAIIVGLTIQSETPPPGNLDDSTPNNDNEVSTQMQAPIWLQNTENLEFLVDDDSLCVSVEI